MAESIVRLREQIAQMGASDARLERLILAFIDETQAELAAREALVRAKVAEKIWELRERLLYQPRSQRPDAVDAVWEAHQIARGGA